MRFHLLIIFFVGTTGNNFESLLLSTGFKSGVLNGYNPTTSQGQFHTISSRCPPDLQFTCGIHNQGGRLLFTNNVGPVVLSGLNVFRSRPALMPSGFHGLWHHTVLKVLRYLLSPSFLAVFFAVLFLGLCLE